MTNLMPLLERAAICFKSAQKQLLAGAVLLYQIRHLNAWEGQYSSFSEYLDQECGMSDSQASKLLKAYEFWVLTNEIPVQELEGIDAEKLYLAAGMEGIPEENLVKARTLSRNELKAEKAVKEGQEHECAPITICKQCNRRMV